MFVRTARRFTAASAPLLQANAAMIVVVITNGVSLLTLQPVINNIFVSTKDPVDFTIPYTSFSGTYSKFQLLIILTAFFVTSRWIYSIALYIQRYFMMVAGEIMVHGLRIDLYNHLLRLSPSFYSKQRSGEMVANVTSDLGLVQHLASTTTADLVRRPFEIVFFIALLCWLDIPLALSSLLVAPFMVVLVKFLGSAARRRAARMQSRMADIAGGLAETFSGIRIIQAFTAENLMAGRFRVMAEDYLARARRAYAISAAANPTTEAVAAVAIAAIMLYGGQAVIGGRMTPGGFFTFVALLLATYQPVKTLVNALAEANRAAAGLERVYALLDTTPAIRSDGTQRAQFFDSIQFENVSFAFPGNNSGAPDHGSETEQARLEVLSEINLTVRRGETVAIVGPSGGGKTTMLSLLPRFYDPTRGRILLDGSDLRALTLESLRKLIGIVTQETFLFNDTIRANIALGKPDASDAEIQAAADAAHISSVIQTMPEGMNTVVGERGARLSGGEKQRIAIARAFLMDPPILILDEATSSLDSESESHVQAAIDRLIQPDKRPDDREPKRKTSGRTTLVIAHRLSTVQKADRIVVIDGGRIVEEGAHSELLARQGLYAKLHSIQFRQ